MGGNARDLLGQLKAIIEEQESTIAHQNQRIKSLQTEVETLNKTCEELREKNQHLEKLA